MSEKNVIKVVIDGKTFRLGGFESKEYLEHVAFYLNNKIAEMQDVRGYSRQKPEMKSILLALNIADDYFKARARADQLEQDLESKDEESYAAKQDLVAAQARIQKLERDLENERNRHANTAAAAGNPRSGNSGAQRASGTGSNASRGNHPENTSAASGNHSAAASGTADRRTVSGSNGRNVSSIPVIPEMSTAERLAMLASERSESAQQKGKAQIDRKKEELFGNSGTSGKNRVNGRAGS